jgi:tetratricopeptide (TPR) repeat protein
MIRCSSAVVLLLFLYCSAAYPQEVMQGEDSPSPTEMEAIKQHNEGTKLMLDKKHQEAIVFLKKAIALNPEFSEAYYNLGLSYERLGEYKDSIKNLKEAIRLSPDDANAYYTLGYVYYQKKKYKKAVNAYEQAARLKPDNPFTYSKLGYAYLARGNVERAREQYQMLKTLNSELADELYDAINKSKK